MGMIIYSYIMPTAQMLQKQYYLRAKASSAMVAV